MKIWNKRDRNVPSDAVYVGRPTKWGNPFTHLGSKYAAQKVETRDEAVDLYRHWIYESPQDWLHTAARLELRGKDLVCWCAPKSCHADVLLEIANAK